MRVLLYNFHIVKLHTSHKNIFQSPEKSFEYDAGWIGWPSKYAVEWIGKSTTSSSGIVSVLSWTNIRGMLQYLFPYVLLFPYKEDLHPIEKVQICNVDYLLAAEISDCN